MADLEKQGWPVNPDDINLLEKEIQQAQTFLQQSKDLRQKSEEVKTVYLLLLQLTVLDIGVET